MPSDSLQIQQANVFYNYAIGLEAISIDLAGTGAKAMNAGIANGVYFSDRKFVWMDDEGKPQVEWIRPEGRHWDGQERIKIEQDLSSHAFNDLLLALECAFHEDRIEGREGGKMPPYLRMALPPLILARNGLNLPIYASLKLHSDGIGILSFQFDGTWDNADEAYFVEEVVNLFKVYFDQVWLDEGIQRLDLEAILPHAYRDQITLGGAPLEGRKIRRMVKRFQKQARSLFEEEMGKGGREFSIDGELESYMRSLEHLKDKIGSQTWTIAVPHT